jgi:hypothetical protein
MKCCGAAPSDAAVQTPWACNSDATAGATHPDDTALRRRHRELGGRARCTMKMRYAPAMCGGPGTMHREDEVLRRHLGRAFLTRQSNVIHPNDVALPRRHHGFVVLTRYPGTTRKEEVRTRDAWDRVRRTVKNE